MPLERMNPEQAQVADEISAFVGRLFLAKNIAMGDGVRILSTMVTWLAIEAGLTADEYGQLMRDAHVQMSKEKRVPS